MRFSSFVVLAAAVIAPALASASADAPRANIPVTADSITTALPEPAAWSLLIVGFGLAGAGFRGRRIARIASPQ
jgi:hypothetical protein